MVASNFSLPDQNGQFHKLSDYRGKWVVLYFYPKDDTPGCTKEACSFRDNMQNLASKNVVVLGISADSSDSHKQFIKKFDLNFILLSDESTEVIKQYNAWGKKIAYGKQIVGVQRKTYLIDPEGNIAKHYEKVDPEKHTKEILDDLHQQQNKDRTDKQAVPPQELGGDDMATETKEESFQVNGENLLKKVKEIIKEGNVRRITIKDKTGKTIIVLPLTVGVVGAVIAPALAAVGAIAALVTECTILVEKK